MVDLSNIIGFSDTAGDAIKLLGKIGLWLQAIGVVIILWTILHIVNWFLNRKRLKEIYSIKEDIKRIEEKIDKILNNKK
ncbi:MAG: hypothetical protein AABY10_06550 [Nanoarchaeota archaeon]